MKISRECGKILARLMILMAGTFFCVNASVAAVGQTGPVSILTTLQEGTNFGGCMARIDPGPATVEAIGGGGNLDCPGDVFVSFDCLATTGIHTKAIGQQMFQTALLAFISDRQVQMQIRDDVKINGFCTAIRVDLQ